LAYVYFEEEPGRRAAGKLLTCDEARRIATSGPKRSRRKGETVEIDRWLRCSAANAVVADGRSTDAPATASIGSSSSPPL
jgi:hypothetical protein